MQFYKPDGGTIILLPPLNSGSGIHPSNGIYYIRITNEIKAKRLRLERKEKIKKIWK